MHLGRLSVDFFSASMNSFGALDLTLEVADFGFAGRGHALGDLAVGDAPGNTLGLVKLGKIVCLGQTQLLKGLLRVLNRLLIPVVGKDGELSENGGCCLGTGGAGVDTG